MTWRMSARALLELISGLARKWLCFHNKLARAHKVNVKGVEVAPRDLILALTPEPSDLSGKTKGITCIGVEVVGRKRGRKAHYFEYAVMDHQEAAEKYGCTGTAYVTAMLAVLFTEFLSQGTIRQRGVLPSEALDPKLFLENLPSKGIRINRICLS